MLPLVLPEADVDKVFADAEAGLTVEIDLPKQVVRRTNGEELPFEVDAFRKHCLVNGLDDINLTLQHEKKVAAFESKRSQETPWLDGVCLFLSINDNVDATMLTRFVQIGYNGKVPVAPSAKKTDW